MAKKRKSDAASLEEIDRTMYSTFCTAANSLSQLYTQAMNHQKLSFQAGERHALEKLYQWILKQQEEGSRVTNVDVIPYLQPLQSRIRFSLLGASEVAILMIHELDDGMKDPSMSPRAPFQQQSTQQPPSTPCQANPFTSAATNPGARSLLSDLHTKNVFSNALSSPVRRNLQHYQLAQGSYHHREGNTWETDSPGLSDSMMDMNADSPSHESSC